MKKNSVFCFPKTIVIYDDINYSISLRKVVFLSKKNNVPEEKGVSNSCPEGNVHLGMVQCIWRGWKRLRVEVSESIIKNCHLELIYYC